MVVESYLLTDGERIPLIRQRDGSYTAHFNEYQLSLFNRELFTEKVDQD